MRIVFLIFLLVSFAFSYELSAEIPVFNAFNQGAFSNAFGAKGVKIKWRSGLEENKISEEIFLGIYNDNVTLSDPIAELTSTFMLGLGGVYFIPVKYGFLLGAKSGGTYGISVRKKGGIQSSLGIYGAGTLRYNRQINSRFVFIEASSVMDIICMPRKIDDNYFFRNENSILNGGGFKLEISLGLGI